MTAGGWLLIVIFVAGLAFYLGWYFGAQRQLASSRFQRDVVPRQEIVELRENARVNVELAAAANYRSGYRDGILEMSRRVLGGRVEAGAAFTGYVPNTLRRWVEGVIERAEEDA